MKSVKKFLWLGGVFDEDTVNNYAAISPASNFWQRGFIKSLLLEGHNVHVIGHPAERAWPFGRLMIRASGATFPRAYSGEAVGYMNAPYLRGWLQYINYVSAVRRHINLEGLPDYLVTFSCLDSVTQLSADIRAAKRLKKRLGIPWICLVADGVAPPGADGYVYLTWSYFDSSESLLPKLHLEGGVPSIPQVVGVELPEHVKAFMYMGSLTEHGGVTFLAGSFTKLVETNVELWICGRGKNEELAKLAHNDKRIKVFGFLDENKLHELASAAYAFVNPRLSDFVPNKMNYPSKLLHYLAYGKPVISTWTPGLSPEYNEILIQVSDQTEEGLATVMRNTLGMSSEEIRRISERISIFNQKISWPNQIVRFLDFLDEKA